VAIRLIKKNLLWLLLITISSQAFGHPMPGSIVHLSVLEKSIQGEAQIPLIELENAVGGQRTANLQDPFFRTYFYKHIQASSNNDLWRTQIQSISTITGKDETVGKYQEVVVRFTLTPENSRDLRTFSFNYDAVIHQVVTHSALVYVEQDWDAGLLSEQPVEVGVIALDIVNNRILPLEVNLQGGSMWTGFIEMIKLGIRHISEGTDHLLFLLALLLPVPLFAAGGKWTSGREVKSSIRHIAWVVTAFTIGHSVTLLLGSLNIVRLPDQPVEILIAVSILISAVHALRPLFAGKENIIAGLFGLVHGLAFAGTLSNLNLDAKRMALSILGFNIGIELMQILVIAITIPWLLLLSRYKIYSWIRISGALFAGVAAMAWIVERVSEIKNPLTGWVEQIAGTAPWMVLVLAVISLSVYYQHKYSKA
jgi:hydrogenase/urease accessory protein HupE